ncbi:tryptophan synthase beta subunit-like PLP-dependent enzyme [Rhypophila decipiens]|uniref:L-serine ammonia-lyase n=1 Tax=Rhypophila decipiens TaxID=261697 RepID=A0AAN6YD57_9PEZI|nr:tryptophan synthase beta subunit-like PLP-dependent enzyme [Rhypophila decipiens]
MGSQGPSPNSNNADLPQPWIETPLIPSVPLSRIAGCNIFLKLENLQPSGSFKSRGIGNMMLLVASSSPEDSKKEIHFYCSSEGNAGLACATTAATLNKKATIVLPVTASPVVIEKLVALGAEVIKAGTNWPEADAHLRNVCLGQSHDSQVQAIYVPPFDHADIWSGAATLVDEIATQLPAVLKKSPHEVILDDDQERQQPVIDAIVCNVGGGGLLNGVMEGLERRKIPLVGHDGLPTKVLALETIGADSLNVSVKRGTHSTLPGITSIAKSLGATRVSRRTWEWAEKYSALGGGGAQDEEKKLISATVTDGEAALACVKFADDARMLIEVSCGATIATVYNGDLRKYLGGKDTSDEEWRKRNVVLVVCGGNNTNLETMERYREEYAGAFDKSVAVVNGSGKG